MAKHNPQGGRRPVQIVWFKRDLRVTDHRPLAAAAARGPVLPLYIVEPGLWSEPDASARHWAFLCECLGELDAALTLLGQPLIVRAGEATAVLEELVRRWHVEALWSHEETGNAWTFARDRRVAGWTRANGVPWYEFRQDGVIRRLANRDGWAARWDRLMADAVTPSPLHLPLVERGEGALTLPSRAELGLADDGCTDRQRGGRSLAVECLETFLDHRGRDYRRQMSTPLGGATACSRLSPHLAYGTVSLREVAQRTWARQRALRDDVRPEAKRFGQSLQSFAGRLHWHCHFMQKLETEPSIEFTELHPALRGARPAMADKDRFEAWSKGETGFPFLDACMRSLRATGWLNFRMRAMVMSFASYNLWLPWRETGLELARLFTDYEPGIHWPQTQMQSGTTGINTIRIYNVVKQGYDQDAGGVFVRRWIPELAGVPDAHIHEPWTWAAAPPSLQSCYPAPIVDLAESARNAKTRIYGRRCDAGFHEAADAIQARHGSRRSGIPNRGQRQRRTRKPNKDDSRQLRLDL